MDINEKPAEPKQCPVCLYLYEWCWDDDDLAWCPQGSSWWFNDRYSFLCSRACYLKAENL